MEQSTSWEANWFSASQEIPRILWNPKVHYRIHKSPPPVPVLKQINRVHVISSWPVASEYTLMVLNNFLSIWSSPWEHMLDKIVYIFNKSDMPV